MNNEWSCRERVNILIIYQSKLQLERDLWHKKMIKTLFYRSWNQWTDAFQEAATRRREICLWTYPTGRVALFLFFLFSFPRVELHGP